MLPSASRLRRSADITAVVRGGRRSRRGTVVVHHLAALRPTGTPPLVGFVVGRTVGGSVVRHQVTRRLRAQLARRLGRLPPGSGTVVRALPDSSTASSDLLGADVDAALSRLLTAART